ncbi:hypothetical protein [Sulfoacidibacillus ferrooxidans]|uniref:Uncharacterized protein n=1 Tax=Sulfoacidibacillus ferrooxidans TaxID=2005001 RepID=A0A9X1VAL3_9BACL|nr:hypothetical protein [Sulfoacidibacillus ferrooxidans]MCI0184458.1 hypothetical protein [Sulfoacidibacillus ferrooxidans]
MENKIARPRKMVKWTYHNHHSTKDARCIFIDLQLELLPYHHYTTLGFDEELIDYIDHVDDSIVFKKIAPLYNNGGREIGIQSIGWTPRTKNIKTV